MAKVKVFARDCYCCGEPMTLNGKRLFFECELCEVEEDATVTGRFKVVFPDGCVWDGKRVMYLDHGIAHYPSPDSTGPLYREPC